MKLKVLAFIIPLVFVIGIWSMREINEASTEDDFESGLFPKNNVEVDTDIEEITQREISQELLVDKEIDSVSWNPPNLNQISIDSSVTFRLPGKRVIDGSIKEIKNTGRDVSVIKGELEDGGRFLLTYGPSTMFGNLLTKEGEFQYKGNLDIGVFEFPPKGKFEGDFVVVEPVIEGINETDS